MLNTPEKIVKDVHKDFGFTALLSPIELLNGIGVLKFKYQHTQKESQKTIMEIRASEYYSVLDDCQAIAFGIWEIQNEARIPVGIFTGIEYKNFFISGSREVLKHKFRSKIDRTPIPEEFCLLDNIHPINQSGSSDAFEFTSQWRDGRLSQIFLGVALEILAGRNIDFVDFNDDKTAFNGKKSVYTRYANGNTLTGREIATRISTQLSSTHLKLLQDFIEN